MRGEEKPTSCHWMVYCTYNMLNKKWLQHVQRMDTTRLPKQALHYKPKWRRNTGRPRKRWRDQLHLEDQGTGNIPKLSRTWWWWICSTCFGHLYAHHQELETICVLLPPMVCNALVAGGRISGAGRIACWPAPDFRPPATKALHTIGGNNTHIFSSSWWWE